MTTTITAADVKKLRDMTDAGMMDCKKALEATAGDFEAAVDFLRKQGLKMAAKRADREATEGVVMAKVHSSRNYGIIVKVSSETDFVAKNESFIAFANSIAEAALENRPADTAALLELKLDGISIAERVAEQVGKIGEKIEVAQYEHVSSSQVAAYIHAGYRAAVLVAINQESAEAYEAAKDVAMQVAAMKPIALDKDDVDAAVVMREMEIVKEQTRLEGKPEEMVEKIAAGRLNKFYKESTLLNQEFVKDSSKSVAQFLESVSKGLTVKSFRYVSLG
ncbi:MAG: translation elongation factor Ts [Saprospiraceae bacterium]